MSEIKLARMAAMLAMKMIDLMKNSPNPLGPSALMVNEFIEDMMKNARLRRNLLPKDCSFSLGGCFAVLL